MTLDEAIEHAEANAKAIATRLENDPDRFGSAERQELAEQKQLAEWLRELQERRAPVPMLMWCPMCHTRHIDEGEFATRPHHTHACQNKKCGFVWRPSINTTVGVQHLPGFLNDPTDE